MNGGHDEYQIGADSCFVRYHSDIRNAERRGSRSNFFLLEHIPVESSADFFFSLALGILIGWFLHSYVEYRHAKETLSDDI
jgi:hypothetical protein